VRAHEAPVLLDEIGVEGGPHGSGGRVPPPLGMSPLGGVIQEGKEREERMEIRPRRGSSDMRPGDFGKDRERQVQPIRTVKDEDRMPVGDIRGPDHEAVRSAGHGLLCGCGVHDAFALGAAPREAALVRP
jgi:hypothetical protein